MWTQVASFLWVAGSHHSGRGCAWRWRGSGWSRGCDGTSPLFSGHYCPIRVGVWSRVAEQKPGRWAQAAAFLWVPGALQAAKGTCLPNMGPGGTHSVARITYPPGRVSAYVSPLFLGVCLCFSPFPLRPFPGAQVLPDHFSFLFFLFLMCLWGEVSSTSYSQPSWSVSTDLGGGKKDLCYLLNTKQLQPLPRDMENVL